MLRRTKFKSENSLVFSYDIHRNISSNWHYNFQYASKWHRTWIINLLYVFSFTIFNKPNSIIAYYESSEDRIWIIAAASISTFASNIVAKFNFLRNFEAVLIANIRFRFCGFLLIFAIQIVFLDLHASAVLSHLHRSSRFLKTSLGFSSVWERCLWCRSVALALLWIYFSHSLFLSWWLGGSSCWFCCTWFWFCDSFLGHCIHSLYLLHHFQRVEPFIHRLFIHFYVLLVFLN